MNNGYSNIREKTYSNEVFDFIARYPKETLRDATVSCVVLLEDGRDGFFAVISMIIEMNDTVDMTMLFTSDNFELDAAIEYADIVDIDWKIYNRTRNYKMSIISKTKQDLENKVGYNMSDLAYHYVWASIKKANKMNGCYLSKESMVEFDKIKNDLRECLY